MTMDNERKTLGERINQTRKDRGITIDKLFGLCNISATYLRQIEGSGKTPSPPVSTSICSSLKVSANYLLQDELDVSGISDTEGLKTLWETVEPSQYELVASILRAAVAYTEGEEQQQQDF